jgi:hypothetical protein
MEEPIRSGERRRGFPLLRKPFAQSDLRRAMAGTNAVDGD